MIADYLAKFERDLTGGVLHLMLLVEIDRLAPIHGYGLIKALTEASGGRELFKEGTIYPILNLLERSGFVKSRWAQGDHGPARKYYELTPTGRQVLRLGVEEWDRVRESMDAILKDHRRSGKR